ncbi:MAG: hypothetical protein KGH61_04085 [Candidatus Micrarchaeota archaeon]|nr:hypothetical protein [Candidatus Micrarchaeota archaeon]
MAAENLPQQQNVPASAQQVPQPQQPAKRSAYLVLAAGILILLQGILTLSDVLISPAGTIISNIISTNLLLALAGIEIILGAVVVFAYLMIKGQQRQKRITWSTVSGLGCVIVIFGAGSGLFGFIGALVGLAGSVSINMLARRGQKQQASLEIKNQWPKP